MGKKYKQLTIQERCEIARLRSCGQSHRKIAPALDRTPSTISRELARNTGQQIGYDPVYACKIIRLIELAPDITTAIVNGRQPASLQLADMMKDFPVLWEDQRQHFGF